MEDLRTVRPRSVVPGRQRWDIGVLLGRPGAATLLEEGLGSSGIRVARANPVTGRILVLHDTALSGEEVEELVRRSVRRLVEPLASTAPDGTGPQPDAIPATTGPRGRIGGPMVLLGGGAAALAVGGLLARWPLLRLGAVLGATAVVVWRGWRRSRRSQRASAVPQELNGHALRQLVAPHKRQFRQASSLSVVAQVLHMMPAAFVGWMLAVLTRGPSAALSSIGLASASSQLWFLAGATGLVLTTYAVVSYISGVQWRDLAQTVQHERRSEMYAHVQKAELLYLEGERTSRLTEVLTADIDQFGRFLSSSANTLLQIATGFVVLIPAFVVFAPNIAWIAFLPAPIIAWLSFRHQDSVASAHALSSEKRSLLNSQLANNLEASATIKSFGAEDYEIDRIRGLSDEFRVSNRRIDTRTTAFEQTVQVCAASSIFGILLFGGLEVLGGTLSVEVYNGLIGLPLRLLLRLPGLGDAVAQYHRTVAAEARVLSIRDLPVESSGTGRSLDLAKVDGEMVFEGVTFAYPGREPVLQDLSLQIAARKTTGIVGVTGAGKTTIAKLALRLQDVGSGRVLLDGVDIRELRLDDLRHAIGFVGQDAFMFDGTAGNNIRYGTFDADPERVVGAARVAEADGFVAALPSQYDTMIGERGVTLSGGQRQRLSLARAIVKSAPILVLDEATSAVDNETEAAIQHALREFARDRTLIVIAHRLSTIRRCDWIYVMGESGAVVEEGTHDGLLEQDGLYASLWRLQIGEAASETR